MADGDAPAPAPVTPVVAAKKPKGDPKYVKVEACPHCGEQKPGSHRQWCAKNPQKRAPMNKKADKAPRKPAAKPAKAPSEAKAFVAKREAELKGDGKPAKAKKEADDKPEPKKTNGTATWLILALAMLLGIGAVVAMLRGGNGPSEQPKDQEAPRLTANAHIPGVGDVHVPGLGESR